MENLYSEEDIKRFVTREVYDAFIHRKIGADELCRLWVDAVKTTSSIPTNELREMIAETIRSYTYGRTPLSLLSQIETYQSLQGSANE